MLRTFILAVALTSLPQQLFAQQYKDLSKVLSQDSKFTGKNIQGKNIVKTAKIFDSYLNSIAPLEVKDGTAKYTKDPSIAFGLAPINLKDFQNLIKKVLANNDYSQPEIDTYLQKNSQTLQRILSHVTGHLVRADILKRAISYAEDAQPIYDASELVNIEDLTSSEDIIRFFKLPPYEVDISEYKVLVTDYSLLPKTDNALIVAAKSSRLPVKGFEELSYSYSLPDTDPKLRITMKTKYSSALIADTFTQAYGATSWIDINSEVFENKALGSLDAVYAVLVEQIQHQIDSLTHPKISDYGFVTIEKEGLEQKYKTSFEPEVTRFLEGTRSSQEYQSWVQKMNDYILQHPLEVFPKDKSRTEIANRLYKNMTESRAKYWYTHLNTLTEIRGYRAAFSYYKMLSSDFESYVEDSLELDAALTKKHAQDSAALYSMEHYYDEEHEPPFIGNSKSLNSIKIRLLKQRYAEAKKPN